MKKNLTLKRNDFCCKHVVGMFFGAGKPDLSGIDGTACRRTDVAGSRWIFDHRSRLAVIGCGGAWDQPQSRAVGSQQSGWKTLRHLFYQCFIFDNRTFFAIPRCATVAFSVGVEQMFPEHDHTMVLALFSVLFFAVVLFFSLRPGKILVWIGKILNPLFLWFFSNSDRAGTAVSHGSDWGVGTDRSV